MTKNNSNWKIIKEEFRNAYIKKVEDIQYLNDNNWTRRDNQETADWIADFFKPYFQEKMHEEAVEELEIVDNNPKE